MKKSGFIICLFMMLFLAPMTMSIKGDTLYTLALQRLDLYQDASHTPIIVNITTKFDYITSIYINLEWTDATLDWDKFGAGNGTSYLANGTAPVRDGVLSPNLITTTAILLQGSIDYLFVSDEKNPESHILSVEVDYTKALSKGLDMRGNHTYGWIIQDDITSYCDNFNVLVIGYTESNVIENRQTPPNILTDMQDFVMEFLSAPLWWVYLLIPLSGIFLIVKYIY